MWRNVSHDVHLGKNMSNNRHKQSGKAKGDANLDPYVLLCTPK
jgi:hypothetical protein